MHAPPTSRKATGFTLLEVMISLAILSIALVALSSLNGGAVQMHAYAARATQATLLVQSKMLDMEEVLQKEGFHDFNDERHGIFDEEGSPPGYSWRAEILKPDVQLSESSLLGLLGIGGDKKDSGSSSGSTSSSSSGLSQALGSAGALLGQLGGGGAGGAPGAGGAGGLAGAGPFAGIIQGQAKAFIETLKKSVREVRITVSWMDGKQERSISASQQIVILPEMVNTAGQSQAVVQPNGQQPGQQPGFGLPGQGSTLPNVKLNNNVSNDGSSQ